LINPSPATLKESELTAGCRRLLQHAVLMVESEATVLSEEKSCLDAVLLVRTKCKAAINAINEFAQAAGTGVVEWIAPEANAELVGLVKEEVEVGIKAAYTIGGKISSAKNT